MKVLIPIVEFDDLIPEWPAGGAVNVVPNRELARQYWLKADG